MLPGGAQQQSASPSFRDRNHRDFAPSWPEAAFSRPGFLHDYSPMCQKVLSKKFRHGRCPDYSHRPNTTNATTTTAVTNAASNTNGILVGL